MPLSERGGDGVGGGVCPKRAEVELMEIVAVDLSSHIDRGRAFGPQGRRRWDLQSRKPARLLTSLLSPAKNGGGGGRVGAEEEIS